MIPFERGPVSYLPLLLCRLIGSEDEQDQELPLPVLLNLARGRFAPLYHLLMASAVAKGERKFQGKLPWDTAVGGWYNPETRPSYTYAFVDQWVEGERWMDRYFDRYTPEQQEVTRRYTKMAASIGDSSVGYAYEITEPLVALFYGLCYRIDTGLVVNEAWLHEVATRL
jgi:hypothetical protein